MAMAHWFLFFIILLRTSASATFVGVTFGTAVTGLPRPEYVADLLKSMGVSQVRLYDTNSAVLTAFAGSGIHVLVGVPNNAIRSVGASNVTAAAWLKNNVIRFLPNTDIRGIIVGEEVLTDYPYAATVLVQTMTYLHDALVSARLDKQIKISTTHSSSLILGAFPPSHAFFNLTYANTVIKPMLGFLSRTGSAFMLNMNPLAIYQQTKQITPIDYVLFEQNNGALDHNTNLKYTNLFDALVDATFSAMAFLNHSDIGVVIGQTGWPWKSNYGEPEASIQNAITYNSNLVKHVLSNKGTPMKPGIAINTYIYELYSEDKKSGLSSQQSWGLFSVNQTAIYSLDLTGATLKDSDVNSSSNGTLGNLTQSWCVAKANVNENVLENALNWACGSGTADCKPIQRGGACFLPDTVVSHASYAFNSYFQGSKQAAESCDFQGSAHVVNTDPSYSNCTYASVSTLSSVANASSGNMSSSGMQVHSSHVAIGLMTLTTLLCLLSI